SNKKYWDGKIKKNVERDLETDIYLVNQGIAVLRLWEHEIKNDINSCYKKLNKLINATKNN
ncbi:very short patch repair endonuclease, partial [Candidatus Peregrinibacteria bacterium CG_4_10_14_0_2_um_filter_43_11]